ncbi:MAG TPA: hypothetical protein VNT55_24460 [Baekduia sp.]|nr:hypothetical protein [Baekduia sp.]
MLADAVPYSGQTTEHRRIVISVRARSVVAVRVGIERYACDTFGDVGPLVVREKVHARIDARGRFALTAGEEAQRLTISGVVRTKARTVTGTLRLRGSIATGQKCASATLRFTARR